MKKNKQLGQGLGALLTPSKQQIEDFSQSSILLSKIKPNPNQPRKNFEDKFSKERVKKLQEEIGVIQDKLKNYQNHSSS